MFTVKHHECVGFESKWKVKKVSANNSCQTEFRTTETGSNTSERKSQEVQTEKTEPTQTDVDMEKLGKWLSKIYPQVKEQIDNSNNSRIFQNYRLLDDPIDATCKLVQTLQVASKGETGSKAIPIIASLQWNNSGKSLAVPYNYKHRTWCHHAGIICIYTLNRDCLSDTPKKRLSTESCVTSIKYHPIHSGILAAGTFTGQIYIWNVENDVDPLICNILAHDEYITQISWMNYIDATNSVCLASSSTDGLLKLWNFDITNNILKIKITYKIKTPVLAKMNQTTEVSEALLDKGQLGLVGFDFSKNIPDLFIVALEGGLIVRCTMLGTTQLKGTATETYFYDPVFKYYEPHKGEIVAIKFSPDRKDLFLTSGTDGQIRIYRIDQDEPAQVIFTKSPLNDISYIPHEEKLVAACGQHGTMEVYHLISGKSVPLSFNAKITRSNLTSLAVNSGNTKFVVLGNKNGQLQLWSVPWQSIEFQNRK
ncbi:cytoplasmic dynein 2 intermediate chain 2-like [Dendroctonus ponderosae]|uniref:Dynein axonemal intermediate chain 4 n=1 Tax=Dendroctonus ponderosae TaxID=77166 RepID=A0AAR5P3N4_DENPD|nr:cytoplasmic dynein 2 intermediate chain 2 [Dendroctonus ponderosae]XP_048520348.1 cytoplasmic dynein 2 intermediate chain 2-like [Dendroctonus ponderosae]